MKIGILGGMGRTATSLYRDLLDTFHVEATFAEVDTEAVIKAILDSLATLSQKNQLAFAPLSIAGIYEQMLGGFRASHPEHRAIHIPEVKQGDMVVSSMGSSGSTLIEFDTGCRVVLNLLH